LEPTEYVLKGTECTEGRVGTYWVCTERNWMHWRGRLEPTEYVL